MEKVGIVFTGSGGQGVITAAIVLAEAAVMHEGLIAVQTQTYGAEARGGSTRSDVIISRSKILFPRVPKPGVLVCLTQESYDKYHSIIYPGGLLITDRSEVNTKGKVDARHIELPLSQSVAEKLGRPVVMNICMLGALAGLTGLVKMESLEKTLRSRLPPELVELNLLALALGLEMVKDLDCQCNIQI